MGLSHGCYYMPDAYIVVAYKITFGNNWQTGTDWDEILEEDIGSGGIDI